jgi:hypothetical protein
VIPGKPWAIDLANIGNLNSTLTNVLGAYNEPDRHADLHDRVRLRDEAAGSLRKHHVSAEQATWLNQAEYLTYLMPRVKSMAQFLLYDLPPLYQYPKGSVRYWYPFQSGLLYLNGKTKPAYYAYRLPIWIPHPAAPAQSVYVWGQIRPATFDGPQAAVLQFKRSDTKHVAVPLNGRDTN